MARRKTKEVIIDNIYNESLVVPEKPNVEDIVVGVTTGGVTENEDIGVTGIPGGLVSPPAVEIPEDNSSVVKESPQEAVYSDADPIIIREDDGTDTVVYPNNNPETELPPKRRIKNASCPYCGGNIRADFTFGRLISKVRCANCGRHIPADYINRYA